jgi:hypothetical protein
LTPIRLAVFFPASRSTVDFPAFFFAPFHAAYKRVLFRIWAIFQPSCARWVDAGVNRCASLLIVISFCIHRTLTRIHSQLNS